MLDRGAQRSGCIHRRAAHDHDSYHGCVGVPLDVAPATRYSRASMVAAISTPAALDPTELDALVVLALQEHDLRARDWQAAAEGPLLAMKPGARAAQFRDTIAALERAGSVVPAYAGSYAIDDAWMPAVLDHAASTKRLNVVAASLATKERWRSSGVYGVESLSMTADLRRALATNDAERLRLLLPRCSVAASASWTIFRWTRAIGMHAPRAWIDRLPAPYHDEYLVAALDLAFRAAHPIGASVLDAAIASETAALRARAAMVLALRGRSEESARALDDRAEGDARDRWLRGARAFVALARGEYDEARRLANVATTGARGQVVEGPAYAGVFALLALVSDDDAPAVAMRQRVAKAERSFRDYPSAIASIDALASFRATGRADGRAAGTANQWIDALIAALVASWIEVRIDADAFAKLGAHARAAGYPWVAAQLDAAVGASDEASNEIALLHALRARRAPWELALAALEGATLAERGVTRAASAAAKDEMVLTWQIALGHWTDGADVTAYVGRAAARLGKRISIDRLAKNPPLALDERDVKIVAALVASTSRWERSVPLRFLTHFADHPRVRDDAGAAIRVTTREPELRVEATAHGARAVLDPSEYDETGTAVLREGDDLIVVTRTGVAARVAEVLGEEGLTVPKAGVARLHQVLATLSGAIPVRASEHVARHARDGDPRIHVQLFRAGAGLRVRLRVVPAGAAGASFRAGEPPLEIVAPGDEGLVRVRRDLAAERANEEALLARCPMLISIPFDGEDRVARELDVCLELLLELAATNAIVEWPEGQALRVPIVKSAVDVHARVGGGDAWLEIGGEVKVDEDRVIEMKDLLESASRAHGRFVPIGEGEFLALTLDLRAKLEALGRAQELATKGKLSAALLPAVETWLDGIDVAWSKEVERRRAALAKAATSKPRVPRTLATELRDYQKDGFVFLARRAEAGLGACLADDMGLGKTVQALALLLHRASLGPALVVVPTSVLRNWESEAARFAPTLNVVRFAEGDRDEAVREAKAGDVVLATYGLLVTSETVLTSRKWSTVVYDEAHALKNASTRRWKSARAITSDAVIALTGTPVENHVGELHAVLDVVVPGMLGPRAAFERGFGAVMMRRGTNDDEAAAREKSRATVAALRQIVRPLVLRRTKSEVLEELPPKTEMTRVVEPSPEHRAFYEATRRRVLDQIKAVAGDESGAGRMDILAAITRLRRAAIDPRLVGGESAPPGAKLDALVELVAELREEGHRALVFSQFLEVLDLAKERLAAGGVECRRLDGTMSASARAAEVDAFQSGQGDVFLLSLKAGGVGMNLTGADFVVHLDPWWNPAVEDQATDRAHRIGQTRPVTIVRLVTGSTIEEHVLALHGVKRKLYEDVVGAADGAGTFNLALLVDLLKGPVATGE
jgi:superfamily II DNA or RNA helicase